MFHIYYMKIERASAACLSKPRFERTANAHINDLLFCPCVCLLQRVIIDWAKDPQRRKCPGLGFFTSKRMEDVVFEDLKIKLGYPYLYCHQGNCEHLLIFTDLRLDYELSIMFSQG